MRLISVFAVTIICAVLVFVSSTVTLTVSASNSVNIFPPDSEPYNMTYADHVKNFWRWVLGVPASENPVDDQIGEKCANGQTNTNSSVFYLTFNTGGKSERTCTVPAGKGLLIPVMQAEYSDKEVPNASVEELRTTVEKDQDSVNSLYLKIGDKEYNYQDLLKYRINPTEPFEAVWADSGLGGIAKGGPSTVVADGYYILTEPLTNGTYSINYRSSMTAPLLAQDIKYTILVK